MTKIMLILFIPVCLTGCGAYQDVKASINPVIEEKNYQMYGIQGSTSITKSLADFDEILFKSKYNMRVNTAEQLLARKVFIDSVIINYAWLSSYQSFRKAKEAGIGRYNILLKLLSSNSIHNTSKEEITLLSNRIEIVKQELELDQVNYQDLLNEFIINTGIQADYFDLTNLFSASDTVLETDLATNAKNALLDNYSYQINKAVLEIYLPAAGLGSSIYYDRISNFISFAGSASFSYNISDVFEKSYKISLIQEEKNIISNDLLTILYKSGSKSMLLESMINTAALKISHLEESLNLSGLILSNNIKIYQQNRIDLYKIKERIDAINEQELKLEMLKNDFFILKMRRQYGILNINIDRNNPFL